MLEKLPESVGHALINQRAGIENVVYNQLYRERQVARLKLTSRAFAFNARLPARFTADGDGLSPPLAWDDVPRDTRAIAMIVEDADSPTPHPLVHAIVTGLERLEGALDEGALSAHRTGGGNGIILGQNSFLQHGWLPPDPPRGHGEHRYVFQVYALREGPAISEALGRGAFIDSVLSRAIGVGCLIGTYQRESRETDGEGQPVAEIGDATVSASPG